MKQFFNLPDVYDNLKVRRLKRIGRIELLRVVESAPYWFVRVADFVEARDRPMLSRVSTSWGNGYFRFGYLKEAEAKFSELATQPEMVSNEVERQKIREKRKQAGLEALRSGKLKSFGKST